MFNPICLFLDAFLALALAWNGFLDDRGLGGLGVPQDSIDTMFDWFLFFCGLEEVE